MPVRCVGANEYRWHLIHRASHIAHINVASVGWLVGPDTCDASADDEGRIECFHIVVAEPKCELYANNSLCI